LSEEERMGIDSLWKRWTEILAALLVGTQEAWRARRALLVAIENKRLVVRPRAGRGDSGDAVSKGPTPAALAAAARRHFVTLELPPEEVVVQGINVPARARDFLPGIVRNQIERLSPWPVDQVAYGFDAVASTADQDTLDARLLMTSRATVEAARAELAGLGITADRVVGRAGAGGAAVTLWSRSGAGSGRGLERVRRVIGATVLATAGASAALSVWLLVSANAISDQSEEIAARTVALQRQLQPKEGGVPSAVRDPAERAWAMKETAPSGVMVVEALSRALPDSAYVTELSLQKSTLRIVGLTGDAPALIAPLQGFGQFADVRFFAPTTRAPDGRLFWFHIEARVEPRIAIAED
jgi:general secretion pathway protein L